MSDKIMAENFSELNEKCHLIEKSMLNLWLEN
jgi:hypothetical protein